MQGEEEALMSLTMTIVMLIAGWLAVAAAMLWGCCGFRGAIITIRFSLLRLRKPRSTECVTRPHIEIEQQRQKPLT